MSCNWLKEPRETARFTQEALAAALKANVKTIKRLEQCGADTPQQVRYSDLATQLKVCPIQLAEHHARDLSANGQPEHARRALEAADALRRARHFPSVDPSPIQSALVACRVTGLGARIAGRVSSLPDEQAQAGHIVKLLNEGDLDGLSFLLNKPLGEAIGAAADGKALDDLARFLRTVVRTCAADDPSLNPAASPSRERWHQHHGESKGWAFTAMIDRSSGLDGMRLIQPRPGTEPRLDDASIRAVRSGRVTQTSVDGRLYELVSAFADLLAFDGDKPPPGDAAAFADFCRRVNQMLWGLNYEDEHVFGLWERANCEPDEVKQQLLQRLPDLRLFDCGEPARTSSVLRVDGAKLETWFASRLKSIAERRKTLATTPVHATQSTQSNPKPESIPMNDTQAAPIQVNLNIHSGNGPANQAAGQAQAHQHNLSTPSAELLPLLDRLLAETGTAEPHYADLRKACRNAQGELEETAVLSEPTKTLLQRAIDALPTADKALGIATKVAELVAKIPGLGA